EPLVLETPIEQLADFITPTKAFYVRNHFPIPQIDKSKWRLRVEGEVEKPFEINFEELTKLESKTIPAMLECAGNSRSFLEPKVKGVQSTELRKTHADAKRRRLPSGDVIVEDDGDADGWALVLASPK